MGILIEVDFEREMRRDLIDILEQHMSAYYELVMSNALDNYDDELMPSDIKEIAKLLDELKEEDEKWDNKMYRIVKED